MKQIDRYQYKTHYRPGLNSSTTLSTPDVPANHKFLFGLSLILAIFIASAYLWFSTHLQAVAATEVITKKEVTQPVFTPNTSELEAKVNALIAAHANMQISVSITDIESTKSYHYGVNEPFLAASTAKLLTATYYLHEVAGGKKTLQQSVAGIPAEQQIQKMIELSDNTAWAALNNLLGKDKLKEYANSIGLVHYNPVNNTMHSDDIAKLTAQLYQGKLLKDEHTQLLLSYMKKANQNTYIPAAISSESGIDVYHKAGWLNDRVHDVAIIEKDNRAFVLAIYTKVNGAFNAQVGQQLFHDITAESIETFFPK